MIARRGVPSELPTPGTPSAFPRDQAAADETPFSTALYSPCRVGDGSRGGVDADL